jgi:hypothetical protein
MRLVSRSISSLVEKLQVMDTTLDSPYNTADMMCNRQTNKWFYMPFILTSVTKNFVPSWYE